MRKFIATVCVSAVLLVLVGCSTFVQESLPEQVDQNIDQAKPVLKTDGQDLGKHDDTTAYPLTVIDSYGREVTIEEKPEAVVSLAPSITETIFALDAEDVLKGRTDYCDYPEEVKEIASIGSLRDPSIEAIASLAPDLVIASTHFKEETLAKLEEIGIKVIVLSSQDRFDGVYEVIEETGRVLDHNKEARDVILNMKAKVQLITEKISDLEPTEVYYVVGFGEYGDYTAGGDTFISQMIEMSGGVNAAAEIKGWSYSIERIIEKDPYMLICSIHHDSKKNIEMTRGYKDLTAVKEGRLFEIDDDLLDVQGPRLADGLEALAKVLHPEAFE